MSDYTLNNKIEGIYPLMPMQEGMLYHRLLDDETHEYFIQNMIQIHRNINDTFVVEALRILMLKYEALRTMIFYSKAAKPRQIVLKEREIEFIIKDLRCVSENQKENELLSIKDKDMQRGFHLEKDSLIRLTLIRMDEDDTILLWSAHHIIMDGWCLSLLFRDFFKYYKKLSSGIDSQTVFYEMEVEKKSIVSYGQYVNLVCNTSANQGLDYWKNLLDGFEEPTELLPLGGNSSAKEQVLKVKVELSIKETEQILNTAKSMQVTVSSLVETALGVLLQKYNHTNDVVIGKVVSGRNGKMKGLEESVGLFINTIVSRIRTKKDELCRELIQSVHKQSIESMEYDKYSLAEIQSLTNLGGSLIQVIYAFENYFVDQSALDEMLLDGIEILESREQTNYPISVSAYLDEKLHLEIMYDPRENGEAYVLGILTHLKNTILKLVCEPEVKVTEITILGESERDIVINKFNHTDQYYDSEKTVIDLFETAVRQHPLHKAVIYQNQTISYEELNQKANKLAHYFRNKGIKSGDLIAVIANRSIEMIIVLLGIMKSQAAYVPIDPDYPIERIQYMIDDCSPKMIITTNCSVKINTEVEVYDYLINHLEELDSSNIDCRRNPNDLLYIIYTSGTTGRPKGVLINNTGVVNFREFLKREYHLTRDDIILQFASFSFDAMVAELSASLLNGGSLCLVPSTIIKDPKLLEGYITDNKVTFAILPPQYMSQIKLDGLRTVISAGSESNKQLIEKVSKYTEYSNDYGPTEATVCATHWKYETNDRLTERIPIGKPIDNKKIYILNENELCGIGMVGELCIAGVGIALGYLNKPELTDEKFIHNPFGKGKLYRTGDLARWLYDGNIEFLGRIDEQVKVRGFRIELSEIENVIKEISFVTGAAVIARKDTSGDMNIYAYMTAEKELDIYDIKSYLSTRLPVYMIPASMMQIDTIPITPNGKLDKRALPSIDVKSNIEYTEPTSELEKILTSIYSEILNVKKVGIHDNFFYLGGHSLKATRLMTRIEALTGIRIPLKEIFQNPTPKELGIYMESLSVKEYKPIPMAAGKEYYSMSSAQKRIFIVDSLDKEGTAYNIPSGLMSDKLLDVVKVNNVLNKLVKRHEILRTSFHTIEGEPVQKIETDVSIEIDYMEMNELPLDLKDEMNRFIKPFDLSKAPLLRVKMIQVKEQNSILLFDMHHIISDGVSIHLLIKEFLSLYQDGNPEPISVQYKDYSEWITTRNLEKQKMYWMNQFTDHIPVLDMPYDYQRPPMQSYNGSHVHNKISNMTKEQIINLSKRYNVTEYMIYLSAFMILLSKYSRQEDIVVGSPISGRTHKDTEQMLGMFVNTLALRGRPEHNKSYNKFLNEIKETCLQAYENQEYPFEDLIDSIHVKRDLSRNPVFDVMFVMQDNNPLQLEMEGVKLQSLDMDNEVSKFDITFAIGSKDQGYDVDIEYCTDLYSNDSIQRMALCYQMILNSIIESPETLLKDITILSDSERSLVLETFNDTYEELVCGRTVVELFEQQVNRTPDQVAVVFRDESITYKELNERVNYLAEKLRNSGVGRDDIVAIITERSIEMIVGIFGIMKAGGAYAPIDPNYPMDRIQYILQDCSPKVILLGNEKFIATIGNLQGQKEYEYYVLTDEIYKTRLKENPIPINEPKDLIYVIYTSGTTGRPKGVMNCHEGLINRILWMNKNYPISQDDVILQKTTYTFDVSVWEIFWWSFVGAKVVMLEPGDEKIPENIYKTIHNEKITTMHFVPSMLNSFLAYLSNVPDHNSYICSLKYVFSSGEALRPESVRNFYKLISDINKHTRLINFYGPTEASIDVTYYNCEDVIKEVPIGKPIANTQIYIMNEQNLCGIGIPGELCIAGIGLARGYLNKPELTNEKFINNPFGLGKLYKTGDLAKWLPDGNIQYLGRIDDQVKIRGFRIELGEIENTLNKIPYITGAAVIVREDNTGEKNIYAYVTSEEKVHISELKKEISKVLADYMVPPYIMQIDELPITKNGKLDKRALPMIEMKSNHEYEAPNTTTEKLLVELFEDILKVDTIGILDNFFDLGGHSLKATKLVNRIEASTGIHVPLKEVFYSPTPKELGAFIDKSIGNEYEPIPIASSKDYYDMSSSQKRIYFLNEIEGGGITYNIPTGFITNTVIDFNKAKKAFQEIIKRHDTLRTSFHTMDGIAVQRIAKEVSVDIAYEEIDKLDYDEISDMMFEFVEPFDLSLAPLIRMKLIQVNNGQSVIFIDMHHIISDGLSMTNFFKEFSALYDNDMLTPLKVQYKDYSEWLSKRDLTSQKMYWIEQFSDSIPVLYLPYDYSRPAVQSYKGNQIHECISDELKDNILELSKQLNVTEYMVYLSAFMILLSRLSRQADLVVGTPISGRTHRDTEDMIGMFVNSLALRGKPEGHKTFHQFLHEMKEVCLHAYENQEYPFNELVEAIEVKRNIARNPLFDVMFLMQNDDLHEYKRNEIRYQMIEMDHVISKFDISFHVSCSDSGYGLDVEYCTDLFMEASIRRMCARYLLILESILPNPEIVLNDINMLSKDESELVLDKFNDTAIDLVKGRTVVELMEEQVIATPYNIAVVYNNSSINYEELNERANYLAYELREKNIGRDDLVVIISDRSYEMIVGIYGILKAGGAYVPIDPNYPEERIQYILNDCKPKVILFGQEKYYDKFNNTKDACLSDRLDGCICINLSNDVYLSRIKENPNRINQPKDLVYVIYTSGTTGKPKGVMNCHEGLVNRILWMNSRYPIGEQDVILQKTTYTFDVSVWEIIWWSFVGAKVVMLETGGEKDPEIICKTIQKEKVTTIHFVPSMLNMFLTYLDSEPKCINEINSLKYVFASGEALRPDNLRSFNKLIQKRNKNTHLINLYGPTEASIDVTYFDCREDIDMIPIGKPIANTQIYILHGINPCGVGMPGELCIAGTGVARGYLNRTELTQEKFIENPFGQGKLYRTGDLAKWLPDGNIAYLGRIDDQVKIRGFRIELGEIENTISKIPNLTGVAVIVREDDNGEKNICAYVESKQTVNIAEIKKEISKELPEYMIPAYMMQIEKIPVTHNGKLDKRSLPNIEVKSDMEYIAPTSKTEKIISQIFESILKINKVGVKDNFFDLGGHSLSANSVMTEISKSFGTKLRLGTIFSNPTIEMLAHVVEKQQLEKHFVIQSVQDCSSDMDTNLTDDIDFSNIDEILGFLEEQIYLYRNMVVLNELLQKVPFSPIQELSVTMNILESCAEMSLNERINLNRLTNAWMVLLREHAMLRSVMYIHQESYYEVYDCERLELIPFIDISNYSKNNQNEIVNKVNQLSQYSNMASYREGMLSSYPILIKLSEYSYKFILHSSHLVMDGFSKDLLMRKLIQYYKDDTNLNQEIIYNNYLNYIESMQQGPATIFESDMIEKYQLNQVLEYANLLETHEKSNYFEHFNYEIDLTIAGLDFSKKMQLVEGLYKAYLKLVYENTNIPIFVVTTGRGYKQNEFYDCIGECIDLMPYLIDLDDDSIFSNIEKLIEYARVYNINFINGFTLKSSSKNLKMISIIERLKELSHVIPVLNLLVLNDVDAISNDIYDYNNLVDKNHESKKVQYHTLRIYESTISLDLPCLTSYTSKLKLTLDTIVSEFRD